MRRRKLLRNAVNAEVPIEMAEAEVTAPLAEAAAAITGKRSFEYSLTSDTV